MSDQIKVRTQVRFDSPGGLLTGEVKHLVTSISNGRKYAWIEVCQALPGINCLRPLDELEVLS